MKNVRTTALLSAVFLLVTSAGVARADNLQTDGDALVSGQQDLAAGAVCAAAPSTRSAEVAVKRTGRANLQNNGNVFDNGAVVTVSGSGSDGIAVSPSSRTITLDEDWESLENNSLSTWAQFSVTASKAGTVSFTATGLDSTGVPQSVNADLTVTASLRTDGPCAPAPDPDPDPAGDTTPPTIEYTVTDCGDAGDPDDSTDDVAPQPLSGPNGDNDWYVTDVCLTWDVGEEESTDTLEAEGCVDHEITQDQAAQEYSCSASSEGGEAGPEIVTIARDATAPTFNVTRPSGSYLLNETVTALYSCSDATSGLAENEDESDWCNGTVASGAPLDTSAVGPAQFSIAAKDEAGNTATWEAVNAATTADAPEYAVTYKTSGTCAGGPGHQILQPIDKDGSSVFKLGSTVPAKFRVCDANDVSVGSPGVVASFRLTKTEAGVTTPVDEAVSSTTPDTAFRWSAEGHQWIYNINTKGLTGATKYFYTITLNDASTIDFAFSLKK